MLDAALAVLTVAVIGVVVLAVLLAVTVAPLLVALARGDRREASPARVGTAAAAGSLVALAVGVKARSLSSIAAVLLLSALAWAVPLLVPFAPRRLVGRAGRHEPATSAAAE